MAAWARCGIDGTFHVSAERYGSTLVLGLDGQLTVESHDAALRALAGALTHDAQAVVLDLALVHRLDCSGIGLLLLVRRQVGRRGGMGVLARVDRQQRQLLVLAGLDAVFRVFGSSVAAVAWCESVATVQAARARPADHRLAPAWNAAQAIGSLALAAHRA